MKEARAPAAAELRADGKDRHTGKIYRPSYQGLYAHSLGKFWKGFLFLIF